MHTADCLEQTSSRVSLCAPLKILSGWSPEWLKVPAIGPERYGAHECGVESGEGLSATLPGLDDISATLDAMLTQIGVAKSKCPEFTHLGL